MPRKKMPRKKKAKKAVLVKKVPIGKVFDVVDLRAVEKTNKHKRYLSYKLCALMLKYKRRKRLPKAIEQAVKEKYPEESEDLYVGFKSK